MKSNLGTRQSLFRQVADQLPFDSHKVTSRDMVDIFSDGDIDHLFYRVQEAIRTRDHESLPWLQLELQARSTMAMRKMEQELCEIRKELAS